MFGNPAKNLQAVEITAGSFIADFGAGAGAYTLELARRAGPHGRVTAVEVQRELLEKIKATADRAGLRNIEVVLGDLEAPRGSKLVDQSQDLVLLGNVLFQAERAKRILAEAARIIRPGGQVAVIDWRSGGPLSPPTALAPERVKELARAIGLDFDREFSAGGEHYGLIFRKGNKE